MDDVLSHICRYWNIYRNIGFFFVLFLLYARTFPVIAQAEVKTILKSSGEKYKKLRDGKMSNKVVHALYDDDDVLLSAVKTIRSEKHHIEEVYTPFPVHGLDKAMGLEETRIAIMAFIYGCIGFVLPCHDEFYHD